MHKIIDFAAIRFPERGVRPHEDDRGADAPDQLSRDPRARASVAKRLERDGVRLGDRVATLAWNGYRHLEA